MPESRGKQSADLTGVVPLQLTDDLRSAFEGYVSSAITKFGVPGAAVAVIQGGEVGYLRGFGVKELGGTQPATVGFTGGTGKPRLTLTVPDNPTGPEQTYIFGPAGSTGNCRRGRVPGNARQAALIRLFGLDFTADQGTPLPRSGPHPGMLRRANLPAWRSSPVRLASSPPASEPRARRGLGAAAPIGTARLRSVWGVATPEPLDVLVRCADRHRVRLPLALLRHRRAPVGPAGVSVYCW